MSGSGVIKYKDKTRRYEWVGRKIAYIKTIYVLMAITGI